MRKILFYPVSTAKTEMFFSAKEWEKKSFLRFKKKIVLNFFYCAFTCIFRHHLLKFIASCLAMRIAQRGLMHNDSYENEFNLHVNKISFSYERGAPRAALRKRLKIVSQWSIVV